jgi:subtilisin family serine protease
MPGELLVKFKPGTTATIKEQMNSNIGAQVIGEFRGEPDLLHMKLPESWAVGLGQDYYTNDPNVEYAEPNYIYQLQAIPNDSFQWGATAPASRRWGLTQIQAPQAWDIATGNPFVVLAHTDTGIDYNHPDIQGNIWVNGGEICGNGIDDDGNGYIDDCFGWNFTNNTGDPLDTVGHGSHTSGIMAAIGNNGIGIAGVNWNVQVMPLKICTSFGCSVAAGVNAIDYAWQNGAWVINASWGGPGNSASLHNAIIRAGNAGVLVVVAAGNSNANIDTRPFYPAAWTDANIITVGATDSLDRRASFSNYGPNRVALGAPGVQILSLARGGGYAIGSGTSQATPFVTGAAGLIWGYNPNLSFWDVKTILLSTVDTPASLRGLWATSGRLNLFNALANTPAPMDAPEKTKSEE